VLIRDRLQLLGRTTRITRSLQLIQEPELNASRIVSGLVCDHLLRHHLALKRLATKESETFYVTPSDPV